MADIDPDRLKAFVSLVVQRGLGLYGQDEMARMCYESGIALTDMNEVDWLDGNPYDNVQQLLIRYGSRNLPAKMTAIILARQHNIPVPEVLLEKRQKKRRWTFRKR
ncbi:MAG: hypothetical protein QXS20_02250 [Candidatus Thorarchaeota archaeon]